MKSFYRYCLILLGVLTIQSGSFAQEDNYRPDLLFREEWKETPAEIPLHQGHVYNPNLIVGLYGPGKDSIKKSHHEQPLDDPYYTWSGLCTGNWAVTLKQKTQHADLSRLSKIRWRTRQSGFRELHIVLKLADDTWFVSRQGDDASIDMETITERKPVHNPDLSDVVEIGYTDLMPGGQSNACSRLDWIEVYGYVVGVPQSL